MTNASVSISHTLPGWRAQLIAARYALPLEFAATIATLAFGGAHG